MAAFDKEEAAQQGRKGIIPPTWTRFSISRVALWINLIGYGLGALVFLAVPLYLLIAMSGQGIAPVEDGIGFLLGLIFLWITLRLLPPAIQSAQHFCLMTPGGFVQVAGKKVVGLPMAEIRSARVEPGLLGAKLVVQQTTGKALVLPIGRIYGGRTLRKMEEALNGSAKSSTASTAAGNVKKPQTADAAPSNAKKPQSASVIAESQKKPATASAKTSSRKNVRRARR
jgi:hypothetical protein